MIASSRSQPRGFTLIELLIALALVGLLSSVALPLYQMTTTRYKETQLREALRTIRNGLDAYKAAVDAGKIKVEAGDSGYPPTLDALTQPIEITPSTGVTMPDDKPKRFVILRRLPRDPFFPDAAAPATESWNTRSYASMPEDPQPGPDVFDISSKSDHVALDGSNYKDW